MIGVFHVNLVHHSDKKSGKENFKSPKQWEWKSSNKSVEIICFDASYTVFVYSFVMSQHCPMVDILELMDRVLGLDSGHSSVAW